MKPPSRRSILTLSLFFSCIAEAPYKKKMLELVALPSTAEHMPTGTRIKLLTDYLSHIPGIYELRVVDGTINRAWILTGTPRRSSQSLI